jgi:hypothetical protein
MSAASDPDGFPDLMRGLVTEFQAKVAALVVKTNDVMPGAAPEQTADLIVIDHLFVLAMEKHGPAGIFWLLECGYQSAKRRLDVGDDELSDVEGAER